MRLTPRSRFSRLRSRVAPLQGVPRARHYFTSSAVPTFKCWWPLGQGTGAHCLQCTTVGQAQWSLEPRRSPRAQPAKAGTGAFLCTWSEPCCGPSGGSDQVP